MSVRQLGKHTEVGEVVGVVERVCRGRQVLDIGPAVGGIVVAAGVGGGLVIDWFGGRRFLLERGPCRGNNGRGWFGGRVGVKTHGQSRVSGKPTEKNSLVSICRFERKFLNELTTHFM